MEEAPPCDYGTGTPSTNGQQPNGHRQLPNLEVLMLVLMLMLTLRSAGMCLCMSRCMSPLELNLHSDTCRAFLVSRSSCRLSSKCPRLHNSTFVCQSTSLSNSDCHGLGRASSFVYCARLTTGSIADTGRVWRLAYSRHRTSRQTAETSIAPKGPNYASTLPLPARANYQRGSWTLWLPSIEGWKRAQSF
jgi:hypothetical protein